MSLKTILEESKSKLTALLSFANETTGQSDTNIGDAIRTLCDGYGGGIVATGNFVPEGDVTEVNVEYHLDHAPDIFFMMIDEEFNKNDFTVIGALIQRALAPNATYPAHGVIFRYYSVHRHTLIDYNQSNQFDADGIWLSSVNNGYHFIGGKTYKWYAINIR